MKYSGFLFSEWISDPRQIIENQLTVRSRLFFWAAHHCQVKRKKTSHVCAALWTVVQKKGKAFGLACMWPYVTHAHWRGYTYSVLPPAWQCYPVL